MSLAVLLPSLLMNNVRTGDPTKDAVISAIILSVVASIIAITQAFWESTIKPFFSKVFKWLKKFLFPKAAPVNVVTRIITYKYTMDEHGNRYKNSIGNEKVLQDAILEHVQKSQVPFETSNLSLWLNTHIFLAKHFYELAIQRLPDMGKWHTVATNIHIFLSERTEAGDQTHKDVPAKNIHVRELMLTSNSHQTIDNFIDNIWKDNCEQERKKDEEKNRSKTIAPKRYFYMLSLNYKAAYAEKHGQGEKEKEKDKVENNNKGLALFDATRYDITENSKTFDSMFFPQKAELLAYVDDFMMKENSPYRKPGHLNKFKVPGCPRKMGFMLEGPPGTGKTSFARALSKYLGRHMVTIPMSEIRSPEQLFEFFNSVLEINTPDGKVKLTSSEIVIVLDEVDGNRGLRKRTFQDTEADEKLSETDHQSDSDDEKTEEDEEEDKDNDKGKEKDTSKTKDVKKKKDKKKKNMKKDRAQMKHVMQTYFQNMMKMGPKSGQQNQVDVWLQVLDGVIEPRDRVIVMTTNHRDWLDPALLRPGRIDMDIRFDFMTYEDLCKLICLYFSPDPTVPDFDLLTDQQRARLKDLPFMFSAAGVENKCIYLKTVDEVISSLEKDSQEKVDKKPE